MPELPDITVYVVAMERLVRGHPIRSLHVKKPFVLRSLESDIRRCIDQPIINVFRLGKQIVWELPNEDFLIFHLMFLGRLSWAHPQTVARRSVDLLSFGFDHGSLILTESGTQHRASLHCAHGTEQLKSFDRGGIEPLDCSFKSFCAVLDSDNSTLKRALTDPAKFSGIGNAYSDEILACAGLSPFFRTSQLDLGQRQRLYEACQQTLREWLDRLLLESEGSFPERVTAFREGMAVHGRFGKPCGRCQTTVQRIIYSDKEFNYCPTCQTDGRILADRSLSRLLKDEWPNRVDDG